MKYRLGLDLGANSIGWAALNLDEKLNEPNSLVQCGVRIFPDGRNPKSRESLAVDRRLARQQRRRRDRFLKRQKRLISVLIKCQLMPECEKARKTLEKIDPYIIRSKALDTLVSPFEMGRAIFHINQRRGFKSNRKSARQDKNESGKVKAAINETVKQLKSSGYRTIGEWLAQRKEKNLGVLARSQGEGASSAYVIYIDRQMVEDELDSLFESQRRLGANYFSDEALFEIKDTLLFQRPLKPVAPGVCTIFPKEPRAANVMLCTQQFRIYQEVNNLRIIDSDYRERPLSILERDRIVQKLNTSKKASFASLKKWIELDESSRFNLETENRRELSGNQTNALMANKNYFGKSWFDFSEELQYSIIEKLANEPNESTLASWLDSVLPEQHWDIERIMDIPFPEGYSSLSEKAIQAVLPYLKASVITYDKAMRQAGINHSDLDTGEWFETLPYYGAVIPRCTGIANELSGNADEATHGRIANPTVHIALNQLRKLVNALIDRYGHPSEIVIEVNRELKLSEKKKKILNTKQVNNKKRNQKYEDFFEGRGLKNTRENRIKMQLWEELNENIAARRCPYSGAQIGIEQLFNGEVEIEHIIPMSRSLDDGMANKTLSFRQENRFKAEHTPYEAFGGSTHGYEWQAILDRADLLPAGKRARFSPNAAEKFAHRDEWLARHLNDTAYISKIAREYLRYICLQRNSVWCTPGKLTALLRKSWGLNNLLSLDGKKNRQDHRHHAVDAVVVGLTTRSLLKKAAEHSKRSKDQELKRLLDQLPTPWGNFFKDTQKTMNDIVVSYKPDHGVEAALHNETAYGLVEPLPDGSWEVVTRKPVSRLSQMDIDKIRDVHLRANITNHVAKSNLNTKHALMEFSERSGVKRVRIIERMSVIGIAATASADPYKAYKGDGNYCYEIWQLDNEKWGGQVISNFVANQAQYRAFQNDRHHYLKHSFDGKTLIMRLCKDDIVALELGDARTLYRVAKISSGVITLAGLNESNADARNRSKDDPFKYVYKSPDALRKVKARRIFVDILGNVKDPGFKYATKDSRN